MSVVEDELSATPIPAASAEVCNLFQAELDKHGYSFQYAVIEAAKQFREKDESSLWNFEVSEFPIDLHDKGSHIDFLLRHQRGTLLMVAECKRANPALSNWCFVKAPYTARGVLATGVLLDRLRVHGVSILAEQVERSLSYDSYHIALEIKASPKGDSSGARPGAINDAVTQVCRSTNGMIEYLLKNPQLMQGKPAVTLIPVIFTTANLWTSAADLRTTDLETGKVNLAESNFQAVDWVLFQYNLSPALKHGGGLPHEMDELGQILLRDYARTVAIVHPRGMERFLKWSGHLNA